MTIRGFLDANVLTSSTIFNWLLALRTASRANKLDWQRIDLATSEKVLQETAATMNFRSPKSTHSDRSRKIIELRSSMDTTIDEVPTDLEFTGTDPNDYHVHAAATATRADVLITLNKPGDFTKHPNAETYIIRTADDFIYELVHDDLELLDEAINIRAKATGRTNEELAHALKKAKCPRAAKLIIKRSESAEPN